MKKIIAAFLSAVLSMPLMAYCYAETAPETDCRDYVGIFDSDEFAEVISDTNGDYFYAGGGRTANRQRPR